MKNVFKINIIGLFLTNAAFAAGFGEGPNPYSPPSHMSLREQAAGKPTGITLDVTTGVGSYQDVQTPLVNSDPGLVESQYRYDRADGSKVVNDSSNHYAPILAARLGWSGDNELGKQFIGFTGMRMSALPSTDKNSAGSSYARLALDGGADWIIGDQLTVLSGVELRRSMYRNTDSGHYIDAIILRTGLTQGFGKFSLGANAGIAPITQFGYMQYATSGSSGGLQATSSSLYEWETRASWTPFKDATLYTGLSQEVVSADMNNVTAYRKLGLNLNEDQSGAPQDRHYRLSTTSFTIGATRRF